MPVLNLLTEFLLPHRILRSRGCGRICFVPSRSPALVVNLLKGESACDPAAARGVARLEPDLWRRRSSAKESPRNSRIRPCAARRRQHANLWELHTNAQFLQSHGSKSIPTSIFGQLRLLQSLVWSSASKRRRRVRLNASIFIEALQPSSLYDAIAGLGTPALTQTLGKDMHNSQNKGRGTTGLSTRGTVGHARSIRGRA